MPSRRLLSLVPSSGFARAGALVAVVFWGTSFVATKILLREVSPFPLVFARSVLGSLVLGSILLLRRDPLVPPRDTWLSLVVMGFVGVSFHLSLQAQGLAWTTAMNTGWLIGLIPLWTAILARFVLHERFGPRKIAGLAVGFLGAGILVTRGNLSPQAFGLPATRGDLLILLSTLNWAVYTVLGHRTLQRLGAVRATAGALLAGWVLLIPILLGVGGASDLTRLSPLGWGSLLFLGIGCSGLGYLFWYGAIERLGATRVAALLYLEPLVTLAAATLVLGEEIRPTVVAGGLLVLGGVILVQTAERSE